MLEINGLEHLLSLTREHRVLVVAFYADWCGPCQQVKPHYEALSRQYNNVVFCRCNIDRNRETANRFGIRGVPAFILWAAGEIKTTITGGQMGALQSAIDQVLRTLPANTTTTASNNHHTIGAIHNKLAQQMETLAQTLASRGNEKSEERAESEVCEAICNTLEQDSERRPFGIALLPYFASNAFDAAAVNALFDYIAKRPQPRCSDGEYIVNVILSHLIEFFLACTINSTKELEMLRQVLYSLISCSSILPILIQSHLFYNNMLSTGLELECSTILGAMLGVGIYTRGNRLSPLHLRSMEWEKVTSMFPKDTDHSQKVSELQIYMESACAANKRIVLALLQSKISREPTFRFFGAALRLNSGYSKTMHHNLPLSSRLFMAQMNDVLLEAALPLFERGYDPHIIPASYVLEDTGDNLMVDFGDDVERITHYDENRPLPVFPSLKEPFKPSVHLFFLAARSIMLSTTVLIETHERDERDATHPQVPPEQRAAYLAESSLIEGLIGSKSLGRKRVRVLNGIAAWLVCVMNVSPDGVLLKEPPEEWQYLPQQLVDVVIRGVQLAPIDCFDVENVISLMLVLMGNTTYFPKPHTHALFPSFLSRLLHDEEAKRALTTHRWFTQHIVLACVLCYIAVEKSTYEKVVVRYTLSYCTKSFLVHESLCQPVRKEFEVDGTILERFSHMVTADVNEAVDQLIETLTKMNQLVREGADLSEGARPPHSERTGGAGNTGNNIRTGRSNNNNNNNNNNNRRINNISNEVADESSDDENDNGDSPMTYHQLGQGLRQHILLFESSMDLFIQLSISFSKGVAQNMVAQQIGQMLARSFVSFAGADSKNLKIKFPERYNFRPKEILGRLVECLAQFRRFHNFLRCLCNCGVPLKDILQAMHTVADRHLVEEHLVWKLREIATTLETISEKISKDEALWDDAPEYALDALLSTPLLDPVALPAEVKDLEDLVYVNRDTIHHVLLSENKHPFTKEYLDENMVNEFNARKDVKEAREKLQSRITAWLEEAKKNH
ncbi:Ubiquitin conjugation factor E4 [Trypanosoma melophagium]|uniref:Ubiquitin conjugation factor E4 n=1 Tax=Trypanosoma melophagium TaxID=715481 RepID=UPI00351A229A|nr:Ubiquitin conjugation factor E4 [Trypanosoma melophagium]